MVDLIYQIKNCISGDICKDIIKRFEQDNNKFIGKVSDTVNKLKKDSMDLHITGKKWKDIEELLYTKLKDGLNEYFDHINQYTDSYISNFFSYYSICDTGYQIQRYLPGGHFDWHTDFKDNGERLIAYIWYLNNVEKEEGGSTEFYSGRKIQPREGTLLLFPTTWVHYHRGCKLLKGCKYIITGFINRVQCDKE